MSGRQALAGVLLWRSGQFDTLDIASLLGLGEADVLRIIHAARHIAKGGAT